MRDDNKGVSEFLDEYEFELPLYVRGSHYLILGKAEGLNSDGKHFTFILTLCSSNLYIFE